MREQAITWYCRVLSEMRCLGEEFWRRLGIVHNEDMLIASEVFQVLIELGLQISSRYAFIVDLRLLVRQSRESREQRSLGAACFESDSIQQSL